MIYVMKSDSEDTGVMIMKRPVIPGHQDVSLDLGVRFEKQLPIFDFVMDEKSQGDVLDFVWTTFPGLVVSAKFRKTLEGHGVDNVDYYPVRIVNEKTGKVHQDYFAANVLGSAACMDMDNSQYAPSLLDPTQVQSIDEFRLDSSRLPEFKLFRLAECSTIVLADESIKRAVEKAKLRGVAFVPADGYSE
jgi:hypothetical protein